MYSEVTFCTIVLATGYNSARNNNLKIFSEIPVRKVAIHISVKTALSTK